MDRLPSIFSNTPVGLVLLSNPLTTSVYRNAVVVVVQYNNMGAMGLCINQPLHLTLNDFDEKKWGRLNHVPVFKGGPMQPKQVIITSMEWNAQHRCLKWQLGLDTQQISQIMADGDDSDIKAYCGYVSWPQDQLLEEIQKAIWLPVPLPSKKIFSIPQPSLWDTLMLQFYPKLMENKQLPKNSSCN